MLRKFKNASLQMKINILFIGMTIFILIVVAVTYYTNTVRTLNISKENQMTTIAVETANKIDRFLFERLADIKVLSESNILVDLKVKETTRLNFLSSVMKAYETYDSIFVIDLDGDVILSTGEVPDINIIKKEFLFKEAYISDIFRTANGDDIMFFSRPLLDEETNHIGAVVVTMNLESINTIVKNVSVEKSGFVKLRIWNSINDVENSRKLSEIIENEKIHLRVTSPVYAFETHAIKWSVEVYQEKEEVYLVIDEFIKYLVLMMFVILVLFTFLSIIISGIITEPIRNLMGKMNKLMKDNKKYNMSIQTRDEVKNLALSFDVLFEQLNFMMQMVLEKTGEAAHVDEITENIKGIFESIPNGILTIDAKGEIKSINRYASQILGLDYDTEKIISIHDRDFPKLNEFLNDLCNSFDNEVKYIDKICYIENNNGKMVAIVFNTLRQTDLFGVLIGMTVIINYMEEKKRFQERISKAKRLSELGEMSAGVAHEIRNPLASIRGYAQIVRMNMEEDDQNYNDLSIVLREVDRLDRIIEQFMDFARPKPPNKTKVSIGELIDETIKLLGSEFRKNGVSIRFIRCRNDIIMVDYEQIEQVILNILINAIQASNSGDEIIVKTIRIDQSFTFKIEVVDSGEGIKDEVLDKIFTPFYTTREKGSGLGLSVSTRIIENHNGIIEIGNNVDSGAKVTIKLPLGGE